MTLLVTAAAGDGIVMGADSALNVIEAGTEQITLTGFPKIIPVPRLHMGISIAGAAKIGRPDQPSWISDWVRQFGLDASAAESPTEFVREFVDALNRVSSQEHGSNTFHVAAWADLRDGTRFVRLPRLFEVSRPPEGGAYRSTSPMTAEMERDILIWRDGQREPYPVQIMTGGLLQGYAGWISTIGVKQHSELIRARVPDPQITSLVEYVRFLIRSIAELYRIARQPAFVGEPVETLILFPEPQNMISMRY